MCRFQFDPNCIKRVFDDFNKCLKEAEIRTQEWELFGRNEEDEEIEKELKKENYFYKTFIQRYIY